MPESMHVQLSRLFGSESRDARMTDRTSDEWRSVLGRVLGELAKYIRANVHSDELHFFLLLACVWAGTESLKEENFFAGYAEAVTRLALFLLGDYPDHRKRKGGAKALDHYDLTARRSLTYSQNQKQRLNNLLLAQRIEFPKAFPDVYADLRQWRDQEGSNADYRDFLAWYRRNRPEIYAGVF